jgi:hypothetical protein
MAIVLVLLLLLPSAATAATTLDGIFTRTGKSESFAAPLTVFGGTTTTQQWSGLIEVILSGQAVNNPPTGLHLDPFWAFSPSNRPSPKGLPLGFASPLLVALHHLNAALLK